MKRKVLSTGHLRMITFLSLVVVILVIFGFQQVLSLLYSRMPRVYGVSFSPDHATYLGLDWEKTYLSILDDLKVQRIRLPTYWTTIEPKDGVYNFSQIDFMLKEASKRHIKVLLVIGIKQPRWPECHIPDWAAKLSLQDRRTKALEYMQKVVERYKNSHPEIWGWQVENEALLNFGWNCDPPDKNFLTEEIKHVRSWDNTRPIIITDTGEWRAWITPMKLSDILGISVYRKAYNPTLGYIQYPFPPIMYELKSFFVRLFFAPHNQKTIITEFQAEPWTQDAITTSTINEQINDFSLKDFSNNITFIKSSSFNEVYFWGVEWWAYMAQHGHPEYWEFAKKLFK